jgi:hypothetical protein
LQRIGADFYLPPLRVEIDRINDLVFMSGFGDYFSVSRSHATSTGSVANDPRPSKIMTAARNNKTNQATRNATWSDACSSGLTTAGLRQHRGRPKTLDFPGICALTSPRPADT